MVYFVTELNNSYHVELLTSKTRIAPIKVQTIPRLELMSARILAKLMSTAKEALEHSVQFAGVYYWLDSKTALCWINNRGEWKQFVRHRVNEILRLSRKEDWGHCPGVENPADLGSRGVTASFLNECELWWKGPKWLSGPTCSWPAVEEILDTEECLEEVKKTVVMKTQVEETFSLENVIDINAYSNIEKVIRVVALVKRFINNLKVRLEGKAAVLGPLKVEETMIAECILIKAAQASLKSRSDYQQLVSQLGIVERDGVLKCKGRFSNAELEIEAREPMILPREHYLTELIIRDCHNRVHHCGLRATLAELRSRFWVPRGRQVVKRVVGSCVVCKKHNGKAYGAPAQADLPEFRVQQSPPFSKVGVDFAGPLFAKEGSDMVKVYIALFTCCVTRAVHLDLVRNLSTPCFLNCLRRFTSRRGAPTLIVSDNAKTFKAAQKAVKALYNSKEVKSYLENNRLEWRFNLERAPWWGGFFERMVGLVKGCLRRVLGNAKLSFEELLTTLVEVEGNLNSRPLTYLYDEEVETDVLTPSHLIFGRRLTSMPDEITNQVSDDEIGEVNRRFRYLARMRKHFWRRWRKEYLTNLREFHKVRNGNESSDAKVGDVV